MVSAFFNLMNLEVYNLSPQKKIILCKFLETIKHGYNEGQKNVR